jgi:predicted GNAT family acetyltransferase
MKRIYFTGVLINKKLDIDASDRTRMAGNVPFTKLNDSKVCWPIIHVMANTLQPGDEAIVVTVRQLDRKVHQESDYNLKLLLREFELLESVGVAQKDPEHPAAEEIGQEMENAEIATGYKNIRLLDITMEETQEDDVVLEACREMIACLDDDAVYYACMTFGTKTFPVCLFAVLRYAEKVKEYAEVGGIYYQEKKWSGNREQTLYDVTKLFRLDEIVDVVAKMPTNKKEELIDRLM